MEMNDYTSWVVDFYKRRDWYNYNPFIRVTFLAEEVGEVSRAVRSLEIGRDRPDERVEDELFYKENLMEELGDVLDNILVLADKYDITLDEIMEHHKNKLEERFKDK